MTMTQQEKDALSQNWDQAKSQVQSQFPGVTDSDLSAGQSDPDQLAETIASKTGQDKEQVAKSLKQIAKQYSS